MAELDPEVLQNTSTLLSTINETISSLDDKIRNIFNLLPETAKAADSAISNATESLGDYQHAAESAATSTDSFSESTEQLSDSTDNASKSVDALSETTKQFSLLNIIVDSVKSATGLTTLEKQLSATAIGFSLLGNSVFSSIGGLTKWGDEIDAIGNKSQDVTKQDINALHDGLSLFNKIPGMGPVVQGLQLVINEVEKLETTVGHVRKFESALLSLRGQFGGFKSMDRFGFIENLPREMSRVNETITQTATATNTSIDEVQKYALELMKIPGAYDTILKESKLINRDMALLEAGMRVARGTTGDFGDAIAAIDLEFRQFGTTSERSLDFMSRMYEMSQVLGVSFKDFKGIVQGIVEGFSAFGDNTKSSTELVAQLGKQLMATGLGIEPTKRIISGITGAMEGLGTAQKAFLSQSTGGAGGLQGAFEIDLLLEQGKIDEVYSRMKESLQGMFGDEFFTREEASQDSNAAAQLYKQIQFLTSGPFGALVKNEADAYKLLQSMQTGEGLPEDLRERAQESLGTALESDRAIQEQQRDSLIDIMNSTKAMLKENQIHTALIARQVVGQGDVAVAIREAELNASGRAAGANTEAFQYEGPEQRLLQSVQETGALIPEITTAAVSNVAEGINVSGIKEPVGTPEHTVIEPSVENQIIEPQISTETPVETSRLPDIRQESRLETPTVSQPSAVKPTLASYAPVISSGVAEQNISPPVSMVQPTMARNIFSEPIRPYNISQPMSVESELAKIPPSISEQARQVINNYSNPVEIRREELPLNTPIINEKEKETLIHDLPTTVADNNRTVLPDTDKRDIAQTVMYEPLPNPEVREVMASTVPAANSPTVRTPETKSIATEGVASNKPINVSVAFPDNFTITLESPTGEQLYKGRAAPNPELSRAITGRAI